MYVLIPVKWCVILLSNYAVDCPAFCLNRSWQEAWEKAHLMCARSIAFSCCQRTLRNWLISGLFSSCFSLLMLDSVRLLLCTFDFLCGLFCCSIFFVIVGNTCLLQWYKVLSNCGFSSKYRIVRPTKIVTSWSAKGNHFCVTPNGCRRQTLVFKQVKTFLAPPNSTDDLKRLIWIRHCVVTNNSPYSTGRQKQPSLSCILCIGVGAGKFLGVRKIFAQMSLNLPEKKLQRKSPQKTSALWFWVPFLQNQSTYSDFANLFTNFAQISTDFAWIFLRSKVLGVRFHPLHPASYTSDLGNIEWRL